MFQAQKQGDDDKRPPPNASLPARVTGSGAPISHSAPPPSHIAASAASHLLRSGYGMLGAQATREDRRARGAAHDTRSHESSEGLTDSADSMSLYSTLSAPNLPIPILVPAGPIQYWWDAHTLRRVLIDHYIMPLTALCPSLSSCNLTMIETIVQDVAQRMPRHDCRHPFERQLATEKPEIARETQVHMMPKALWDHKRHGIWPFATKGLEAMMQEAAPLPMEHPPFFMTYASQMIHKKKASPCSEMHRLTIPFLEKVVHRLIMGLLYDYLWACIHTLSTNQHQSPLQYEMYHRPLEILGNVLCNQEGLTNIENWKRNNLIITVDTLFEHPASTQEAGLEALITELFIHQ